MWDMRIAIVSLGRTENSMVIKKSSMHTYTLCSQLCQSEFHLLFLIWAFDMGICVIEQRNGKLFTVIKVLLYRICVHINLSWTNRLHAFKKDKKLVEHVQRAQLFKFYARFHNCNLSSQFLFTFISNVTAAAYSVNIFLFNFMLHWIINEEYSLVSQKK